MTEELSVFPSTEDADNRYRHRAETESNSSPPALQRFCASRNSSQASDSSEPETQRHEADMSLPEGTGGAEN